jgi:hypothetical protein
MELNAGPLTYTAMITYVGGLAVTGSHLTVTLTPCLLVKLNKQ